MEVFLYGSVGSLLWYQYALILFVLTWLTIFAVTLYLHRGKTHRSVDFSPTVEHVFRFIIWLTTGMKVHEWVAVHRYHHKKCDVEGDPHSPLIEGVRNIIVKGSFYYNRRKKSPEVLACVQGDRAAGLPNDWLERNLYSKHNLLGIILLFLVQTFLFGLVGFVMWVIQMAWIPFWAAGVINGVGHHWGYRCADTPDESRNISPIGILIGGEELHHNHHLYPTSAKFSLYWWEFDVGWGALCLLRKLGLAKINRVSYIPMVNPKPNQPSAKKLFNIFVHHKYLISAWYRETVDGEDVPSDLNQEFWTFFSEKNSLTEQNLLSWCKKARQSGNRNLTKFVETICSLHEREDVYRNLKLDNG